jgi:hypothetical protein
VLQPMRNQWGFQVTIQPVGIGMRRRPGRFPAAQCTAQRKAPAGLDRRQGHCRKVDARRWLLDYRCRSKDPRRNQTPARKFLQGNKMGKRGRRRLHMVAPSGDRPHRHWCEVGPAVALCTGSLPAVTHALARLRLWPSCEPAEQITVLLQPRRTV